MININTIGDDIFQIMNNVDNIMIVSGLIRHFT